MKKTQSAESWMIANGKPGQVFYSVKEDKHLTAMATYYQRKITTERIVSVSTAKKEPVANFLTKVTLL